MTTGPPGRPPMTAKLTARKATTIRAAYASEDGPTQAALARQHGVGRSTASLVVRGLTRR